MFEKLVKFQFINIMINKEKRLVNLMTEESTFNSAYMKMFL